MPWSHSLWHHHLHLLPIYRVVYQQSLPCHDAGWYCYHYRLWHGLCAHGRWIIDLLLRWLIIAVSYTTPKLLFEPTTKSAQVPSPTCCHWPLVRMSLHVLGSGGTKSKLIVPLNDTLRRRMVDLIIGLGSHAALFALRTKLLLPF